MSKILTSIREWYLYYSSVIKFAAGLVCLVAVVWGLTLIHPGLGLAAFGWLLFDLVTS